jgi:hypothetical protein
MTRPVKSTGSIMTAAMRSPCTAKAAATEEKSLNSARIASARLLPFAVEAGLEVGVAAVVGVAELEDERAVRLHPRELDGQHPGLGARFGETHLPATADAGGLKFGKGDLGVRRAAPRRPAFQNAQAFPDEGRMGMAVD